MREGGAVMEGRVQGGRGEEQRRRQGRRRHIAGAAGSPKLSFPRDQRAARSQRPALPRASAPPPRPARRRHRRRAASS